LPNCCPPENRRRAFLACLPGLALCAGPTAAAPTRVEPFDAESWAEWPRQVTARNQPLMVVFSATWCAVCPQLIDRLAADPRRRRRGVPLWVVMTDLAPGENDARLLASPHYHVADRLLAHRPRPPSRTPGCAAPWPAEGHRHVCQITSAGGGKLVSASSPVAGVVEIHEMSMDGNT
jgi:hypothetical protein